MGIKQIRYHTGKEIFKVKIEDDSGAFIENWVFMRDDFPEWVRIMCKKFGFKFVKVTEKSESIDKDLDWTK